MRLWLPVCLLAGCAGMGSDNAWMAPDEITPPFEPEVGQANLSFKPSAGTLRIVSYNIKDGGVDPSEIAAAFRANSNLASADVVLIQEAEAFPDENGTRISRMAEDLGMAWIYAPARPQDAGTLGDAILSRYPLDDLAVMRLPLAPNKRQRIAVAATIDFGGEPIRVVTTHLDTSLNITDRIVQLHPVVRDLEETAIVGGDFNTNPYAWQDGQIPLIPTSQVVDTDQAPLLDDYMSRLGFANPVAALGATEIRYGIESRLDAVFVRGLVVGSSGVERSVDLSDHWPVWTDIKIQP